MAVNYWEVRRDGVTVCYGSKYSMPPLEDRKMLRDGGMKIYVEGKLFREQKESKRC